MNVCDCVCINVCECLCERVCVCECVCVCARSATFVEVLLHEFLQTPLFAENTHVSPKCKKSP